MLAYSGHWSREQSVAQARMDMEKARQRAKDARRRHRNLPLWQRVLDNLDTVLAKIRELERQPPRVVVKQGGPDKQRKRLAHQLKRYNKLMARLGAFDRKES